MRLLLVETVIPKRFIGGNLFPFVHGLAWKEAIPCRWLRFAVAPDVLQRYAAGLPPEDVAALLQAIGDPPVSHVLFSRHPPALLASELVRALPDLRLGAFRARWDGDQRGPAELLDERVDAVRKWLGLAPAGRDPLEQAVGEPRYDFEPGNAVAARMAPLVTILTGRDCTYQRDLRESCFFASREPPLAGLPERWGCSFCANSAPGPADREATPDPFEQLRRQVVGIAQTQPKSPYWPVARVMGAAVRADPARAARIIVEAGAPRTRWLFDYRADGVVRSADAIRDALQVLAAAGHRFEVCLVGVESFSARQLDRLAKGYPPERNLQAIRLLRGLRHDWPRAFAFEGLSNITYDPWCTFGDVAFTLTVARRFRLERLMGKLLTSRLRLEPQFPLYAAARADGLLVDDCADAWLDTAQRNYYADEHPWRFADPRLEPVNRLTVRLDAPPGGEIDPLARRLRQVVGDQDRIAFAERLVHAAVECPTPLEPDDLLARAAGAGRSSARSADDRPGVEPPREEPPFGLWFGQSFVDALRTGTKPVLLQEGSGDLGALAAELPTLALRHAPGMGGGVDYFAGLDVELVERAVALRARQHGGTSTTAAAIEVTAAIGVLLGYPPCCAAAFAEAAVRSRPDGAWLAVRRRLETPGPVDPLFNPAVVGYVPCSLRCEATRALAARVQSHLAEPERALVHGGRLTLVLCELERFAQLEIAGEPSHRPDGSVVAPYRVSGARVDDAVRAALSRGDQLSIEPGFVRVLSGRREVGVFAECFVWWHREAFHAEFWREYLRQIEDPLVDDPPAPARSRTGASRPERRRPPPG